MRIKVLGVETIIVSWEIIRVVEEEIFIDQLAHIMVMVKIFIRKVILIEISSSGGYENQTIRGNSGIRRFRGKTVYRNSRGRNNSRRNRQGHFANSIGGSNQGNARENTNQEGTQENVNLNALGPR